MKRNISNKQVLKSVKVGRPRSSKLRCPGAALEARKQPASKSAKTFLTAEGFRSSHSCGSCGAGVGPLHQPQEAVMILNFAGTKQQGMSIFCNRCELFLVVLVFHTDSKFCLIYTKCILVAGFLSWSQIPASNYRDSQLCNSKNASLKQQIIT